MLVPPGSRAHATAESVRPGISQGIPRSREVHDHERSPVLQRHQLECSPDGKLHAGIQHQTLCGSRARGPADGCPEPSHDAPELAVQVLRPEVFSRHNRLLRKPAHINSELFLVRQLSVICARSHDVRSWLGELCCRDGFAVFHLNGSGIKRDRRRPAPEKPIDTESLLALTTLAGVPTASTNRRDVDWHLRLVRPGCESWWGFLPDRARGRPLPRCRKTIVLDGCSQC